MVFVWLRKSEIPRYICGSTYPEKANYIVHIDTRQEQLTELGLQCYKLVDVVSYEMVKKQYLVLRQGQNNWATFCIERQSNYCTTDISNNGLGINVLFLF